MAVQSLLRPRSVLVSGDVTLSAGSTKLTAPSTSTRTGSVSAYGLVSAFDDRIHQGSLGEDEGRGMHRRDPDMRQRA
jgi:hypothetical protein